MFKRSALGLALLAFLLALSVREALPATDNLGCLQASGQGGADFAALNNGLNCGDLAANETVSVALSDANYTLNQSELASGGRLVFTGALTAARTVTLPAGVSRIVTVENATTGGFDLTFGYAAGATVTVAAGQAVEIAGDATDVERGADQNIMDLPTLVPNSATDWFLAYDNNNDRVARVLGDDLPGSGGGGGGGVGPARLFIHFQDQKSEDTNGQSLTQDAWTIRHINTVLTNTIPGASLASNQITLPPGTYWCDVNQAAHNASRVISRMWNDTDGAVELHGLNTQDSTASVNSIVRGSFTITAEKDFEFHTLVQLSGAIGGLATGTGVSTTIPHETYLDGVCVQIEDIPNVETTDATQTTLHNEGIVAETGVTIEATIQGREAAGGALFSQTLFFVVRNEGGTGSISTVTKAPATAASLGTVTGWSVTADVDTTPTPDEWRLRVTGAAATTIDWTATIKRIAQTD